MLMNLLDLDNNVSVRDVHKEEKSSKRSTGVLNKIISFDIVLYLFRLVVLLMGIWFEWPY